MLKAKVLLGLLMLSGSTLLASWPVSAQQAVAPCVTIPRTGNVASCAPVTSTNPLPVTPSAPVGTQDVNLKQVNGTTVTVGVGAGAAGTQRVTTSTDSTIGTVTAVTAITNALPAGAALLGKVGIDQTTPGTTNGVVVNSGTLTAVTALTNALPAGSNIIGNVRVDQTTPGTTNGVVVNSGTLTGVTTVSTVTAVTTVGTVTNPVGVKGADGSGISSTANPFPVGSPLGITPTDRTITSATGASQTLANANAARRGLIVQNTGSSNCGVNPTGGTALIGGAGTLTLVPTGSYQPRIPTLSAVTAICTSGQPLYAEEN